MVLDKYSEYLQMAKTKKRVSTLWNVETKNGTAKGLSSRQ
jgi:hypothetical protein